MSESTEAHTVGLDESDPKSGSTFVVGGVGIALLIVIVVLLEVLYYRTADAEIERKVIAEQPQELRQAQAEQLEQLGGYRWIDEKQGIVGIPIERAMQRIVEESRGSGKPR